MAEYVPLERLTRQVSDAATTETEVLQAQLADLQVWQDHELASERAKEGIRKLIGRVTFELSMRPEEADDLSTFEYASSEV